MTFGLYKLKDLLKQQENVKVEAFLKNFKGINLSDNPHEVEYFLHNQSIDFEKKGISTTYLVIEEETKTILGFFSLSNKAFTMSSDDFDALLKKQKRILRPYGRKSQNTFELNSYLIGQLGKNYSSSANGKITGQELLTKAYDKVIEASEIIGSKFIWLECEKIDKIIDFYSRFGFIEIENYTSENGLSVMVLKIFDEE